MEDWKTHPKVLAYYRRATTKRVRESKRLLDVTRLSGVTDETEIFLEFRFIAPFQHELHKLRDYLLDDYHVSLTQNEAFGAWFLDGTTRPNTTTRSYTALLDWVSEMLGHATMNGCAFTRWKLVVADGGQEFSTFTFSS